MSRWSLRLIFWKLTAWVKQLVLYPNSQTKKEAHNIVLTLTLVYILYYVYTGNSNKQKQFGMRKILKYLS